MAARTYRDEPTTLQGQVEAANKAARLSRARSNGGATSCLEVLVSEQSPFTAKLAESQTLRLCINAIIELYKALGGGWVAPVEAADQGREGEVLSESTVNNEAKTLGTD